MSRAIEVSGAGGFIEVGAGGASIDVTFHAATGGGGGAVASVNGQTGVVVLDAADVGADPAGTATGLVDDLSGVTNQVIARTNLGLGTAAVTDTGTGASNTILGDDARLSDARTPTAHAASHTDGGADELALDGSQITTGLVGVARLGAGTPDSSTVLKGDGTWGAATARLFPFMTTPAGYYQGMVAATKTSPADYSTGTTTSGSIQAAGLCPIRVLASTSYDEIAVYCKTAGTDAGVEAYLGYCPANADGTPNIAAAVQLGSVSLSTTGLKSIALSPTVTLGPGDYWLIFAPFTAGTTAGTNPKIMGVSGASVHGAVNLASTAAVAYSVACSRSAHGDLSTLSTLVLSGETEYLAPRIGMRVA